MNLLLISNMYPINDDDYFGIFVKKFCEGMSENFYIHKCVIKGNSPSKIIKLIKYIIFYIKIFYNSFKNYDVIYIHFPTRSVLPLIFNPFLNTNKIIINFHGSEINSNNKTNNYLNNFIRGFVKKVGLVVVPSESFIKPINDSFDVENVFISPSSGVPDNFYSTQKNGLENRIVKFVFMSSLMEGKGVFTLLRAIEILIQDNINFNCFIYGKGSLSKDVDLFCLKHSKFVTFLGSLNNEKIPIEFQSYDFFVFPSKSESLGLVGLEALACGLPVIGSNISGIKSFLIKNFNGLLFESENHVQLAEHIKKLVYDKNFLKYLKSNSRNSVLNYKSSHVSNELSIKIHETIRISRNKMSSN